MHKQNVSHGTDNAKYGDYNSESTADYEEQFYWLANKAEN